MPGPKHEHEQNQHTPQIVILDRDIEQPEAYDTTATMLKKNNTKGAEPGSQSKRKQRSGIEISVAVPISAAIAGGNAAGT